MSFSLRLLRTEALAFAVLTVASVLLASLFALHPFQDNPPVVHGWRAFYAVLSAMMLIGGPAVLVFGAPSYAFLLHHGKVSWWAVIAIGVLPGLALLLLDRELGFYSLICGVCVAGGTHLLSGMCSNYVVKRTAGRGFDVS